MSRAIADNQSPWVLFGWDLGGVVAQFRLGVRQLFWDPVGGVRARLEGPIALHDSETGDVQVFTDAGPSPDAIDECTWQVLRLPDDLVLRRELKLPAVLEPELESTVELDVHANSPFPPEERVVGWRVVARDESTLTVCVVITTRTGVARFLAQPRPAGINPESAPELWCLSDEQVPVTIPGYGEDSRAQAYRQSLLRILGVAATVFALVFATLAVPVIISSLRAANLESLLAEVRSEVREEMALRDELGEANALLESLGDIVAGEPPASMVLNRLARDTPDTVYLNRVEYEDSRLRISGFADDAAEYMQLLSEQAWLEDVTSPTAFQRDPRTGRERFTLDAGLRDRAGLPITQGQQQ